MSLYSMYTLADGVQVRDEVFGLLFYNYRGPRLVFVPSNDLIGSDFFDGRRNVGQLIEAIAGKYPWPRIRIEKRIQQLLDTLEQKGLIHGQSIC